MSNYDLSHLTQGDMQMVMGPIQDDEALFLYSIIKGMRLKTIMEIGFGDGYSAKNFLKAVGNDGLVISIDNGDWVYNIQENHIGICKDAGLVEKEDLPVDKLDMIFFDCHNYECQISLFDKLRTANIITNKTVLALHDTNTWIHNNIIVHSHTFNISNFVITVTPCLKGKFSSCEFG